METNDSCVAGCAGGLAALVCLAGSGRRTASPWPDAKAKQAVILDTRPSYFYQGWPMEGRSRGYVVGAELLSAEWKYSDEEWPRR